MMDPEVSVLFHCTGWRGLVESQVQVELSERFNRQTDPTLEQQIEEAWTERVTKDPWLFNGAKFRLHSFTLTSPPSTLSSFSPASPQPKCPQLPPSPRKDGSGCADRGNCCTRREEQCLRDTDGGAAILPICDAQWSSNCGIARDSVNQSGHRDCVNQSGHRDGSFSCGVKNTTLVNARDTQTSPPTKDCCVPGEPAVCRTLEAQTQKQPCPGRDEAPVLTLRLGLTCYKDFLGTNWCPAVGELCRRGEAEYGDPLALLAQPLGVGGVLCTCDGQVVLIRRSQRVAEAGGLLDVPGGHPEPKAVSGDQITMALLQTRQEAVVKELFCSVCAEIRDEVNVPLCSLGEPVLLGVALNHTSSGRPSAEFYISCSLSSAEVRELYWRGGPEAHESTDIVFLSQTELQQLDKSAPLWSELCPSAKGAVVLYQLVLPDQDDPSDKHSPARY